MKQGCVFASNGSGASGEPLSGPVAHAQVRSDSSRCEVATSRRGGRSRSMTSTRSSTCFDVAKVAAPSSTYLNPDQIFQTYGSSSWRTHGSAK